MAVVESWVRLLTRENNVAATDELAVDIHLRDCGPLAAMSVIRRMLKAEIPCDWWLPSA